MTEIVKEECRFFLGDRPCVPHKQHGVHCSDCQFYDKISERILIIKLGAAGDVIRTTPLLRRLKSEFPRSSVSWLTDYPELLPSVVDEKIKYSERTVHWLSSRSFDLCINLDKDREAIAIAEAVSAPRKYGFGMDRFGKARAFNPAAQSKLITGVFDDISKRNTKSYPQEIFEICGYRFQGEKYILEDGSKRSWELNHSVPIVGLNTGCGARWRSRLWPDSYWSQLGETIKRRGMEVIWLGGPDENDRNQGLCARIGGRYFGVLPLNDYVGLVNECDVVVTQVTMALHIALGLGKQVVLLNNIFNKYEFELYGLGTIIEPEVPCGCYYAPDCPHDSMKMIKVPTVYQAIANIVDGRQG